MRRLIGVTRRKVTKTQQCGRPAPQQPAGRSTPPRGSPQFFDRAGIRAREIRGCRLPRLEFEAQWRVAYALVVDHRSLTVAGAAQASNGRVGARSFSPVSRLTRALKCAWAPDTVAAGSMYGGRRAGQHANGTTAGASASLRPVDIALLWFCVDVPNHIHRPPLTVDRADFLQL